MRPELVVERFELWRQLGWMRPLEARFVSFLRDLDPQGDGLVLLAAGLVSHALAQGHVALDMDSLVRDPVRWLALPREEYQQTPLGHGDQAALEQVQQSVTEHIGSMDTDAWLATLKQSRLVAAGRGTSPLVLEGSRLYLRRNWAAGREVSDALTARAQPLTLPIALSRLRQLLNELFPPEQGATSPDWQKIGCAVALRYGFSILTGGPGTGKTWTVVKLLALLQACNQAEQTSRPLRVMLAAPTGKAAARMSEAVCHSWEALPDRLRVEAWRPEEARTLHRLLGTRFGSRHFRHQRTNPVQADVIIVDEASMIDLQLMLALVRGTGPQTRLVLLGDKDQLASVEPGAVFGELCRKAEREGFDAELTDWLEASCGERIIASSQNTDKHLNHHVVMLRKAHRFNEDIAALAEAVNTGQAEQAIQLLDSRAPVLTRLEPNSPDDESLRHLLIDQGHARYLQTVHQPAWLQGASATTIQQAASSSDELERWARACLTALGRFQILTSTRHGPWGVEQTNRRVRDWLTASGQLDGEGVWFHGRPVMVTRNDYRSGLMNGDVGLCLYWPQSDGSLSLRVAFQRADGRLHHYATNRIADCQTAWVMTVHKSQGSEFAHTVLLLPARNSPVLTRELVYTGLTRARERFTLIAPSLDVFRQASQQRARG